MPDTTKPNTTEPTIPTIEDFARIAVRAVLGSIRRVEDALADLDTRLSDLDARIAASKENNE